MKKKLLTLLTTCCLAISSLFGLTGCGGAEIEKSDWKTVLHYYPAYPTFTVYEFPNERALTYVFDGDSENVLDKTNYHVMVSNKFEGDDFASAKISSMDFRCGTTNKTRTPIGGEWYVKNERGSYVDNCEKGEYTGDPITTSELYAWLFDWSKDNYSAFEKKSESKNGVVYKVKKDRLKAINTECQKVYADSTVSEVCLIFEVLGKDLYGARLSNSSDNYRLDGISVKDKNGQLFAIKNIETTIMQSAHEIVFKRFKDVSNFTLKGGTGVDYGEYYFTENAVKIYTPNNPNEDQREAYFVADYENQTAKYIKKTAQGQWTTQSISIAEFENRKESLIDVYFGGIIDNGYGSFKEYTLRYDAKLKWFGDEIQAKLSGYDLKYKNLTIQFDTRYISNSTGTKIEEMSFDYEMSANGTSVTHHFELTNGGTTTVEVPVVE